VYVALLELHDFSDLVDDVYISICTYLLMLDDVYISICTYLLMPSCHVQIVALSCSNCSLSIVMENLQLLHLKFGTKIYVFWADIEAHYV